jgi:hypothetical protein
MSSPPLWLSMEPMSAYTQLLLSQTGAGTMLKARLAPAPARPGGVAMLLEALSAWQGAPLCAVLDVDAEEVRRARERWARMLGEASQSPHIRVEWTALGDGEPSRGRFFEGMGDFSSARRLLVRGATGQR